MAFKFYLPLLFIIFNFKYAVAQKDSTLAFKYVTINPADDDGRIVKSIIGRTVKITVTRAYVNLFVGDPDVFYCRLNNRDYDPHLKDSTVFGGTKIPLASTTKSIYLAPDTHFTFEIFDKMTGALVYRYIVSRPKIVPELNFYRVGDKAPFFNVPNNGRPEWLSMKPGELIVGVNLRADFKNLKVEYVLRNQTTGSAQSGDNEKVFSLNLEPGTVYELRYNYVDQPETLRTYTMFVKPYWYKSKKFYAALLVLVISAGIGSLIWFYRNRLKLSTGKQENLEQAAIRLQSLLNPHFTFNALSSIQGLMNTNRIDEANHYLQEFSGLLRKTLAKSQHVFNSLDQELGMMRMYLHLEALRFNFKWDIDLSDELDQTAIEIPTLILQPLIENAIKHGINGLNDKGKLEIVCKPAQEKYSFVLVVKDNGTWVDKPTDSGYGLSLTKERIVTINKMKQNQHITLEFDKRWGTAAILTFHNWIES